MVNPGINNLTINPKFNILKDPVKIIDHIKVLKEKEEPFKHSEVLNKLLQKVNKVDFKSLAFSFEYQPIISDEEKSDLISKYKVTKNQYLVLSIEQLLEIAKVNSWDLCKNHDFIYLYNGTFWANINKETFQKFLGEAAEEMGVAKFSARFYQFREQLYRQFLATAYLPTPEIDKNTVLINLKNGTFEISPYGTRLRPFDRLDFITYQLPFEHNLEATAPKFQAYLDRVLPDIERQKVLAEYLGYIFIKHGSNTLKEEKALILYGTGANGKSVFFEVINALLGTENVSSYSLQSLTNDNGYFRAKLANKLVNYASEINNKLEASIFKQMVSGEPVEARLPYGQPFMLKQYAKLIFNCNELPKDVEHTNAFFRRFLIIPFDVTIPETEQDKQLHTKIIDTELSGVFNWVLEGLNRLLQQKRFSDCEAAIQAVEQYKTESNSIKLFLEEKGYQSSPDNFHLIQRLYPEYRTYCIEDGMTAFKKINFSKQLQELGIQIDREAGTGQKIAYLTKGNEPF